MRYRPFTSANETPGFRTAQPNTKHYNTKSLRFFPGKGTKMSVQNLHKETNFSFVKLATKKAPKAFL